MARPELGTKRVCPTTGRKFYDLNRNPIISPYTGQIVTIAAPVLSRTARAEVAPVKVSEDDPDVEVLPDVELVALEEADEDPAAAKVVEDDIEVEDDGVADDTFLEEEEDEDADVTDLIGDGIEDDEEP
ncbi:MAG: TIGR02300 family protein [Labrys sp. (in: a-proteobacteria)]